jgi:hypothetical protein
MNSGLLRALTVALALCVGGCADDGDDDAMDTAGGDALADGSGGDTGEADTVDLDVQGDTGGGDAASDAGGDAAGDAVGADASGDTADSGDSGDSGTEDADAAGEIPSVANAALFFGPDKAYAVGVRFETDMAATSRVEVAGPEGSWDVPAEGRVSDAGGTSHTVYALGLLPETAYTLHVTALGAGGAESPAVTLEHTTDVAPTDIPHMTVKTAVPEKMSPGLTWIPAQRSVDPPNADNGWGALVAVDAEAAVRWYYQASAPIFSFQPVGQGRMLLGLGKTALREIDLLGNTVVEYTVDDLGIDSIHHDVLAMPSGDWLLLDSELRSIEGYPGDVTHNVVGDLIRQVTREGEVTHTLNLFDFWDPYRVVAGFDNTYWDSTYPDAKPTKDWTHGNALLYDPADDAVFISIRHQDAFLKMDRETGEILWAIGADLAQYEGDDDVPFLELVGPGSLPEHAHAPLFLPGGRFMCYDNSLYGKKSRAVEYQLDLEAGTIEQTWEFVDPDFDPPLFSRILGDANLLPGDTVLQVDGGIIEQNPGSSDLMWARVTEITRDETKQKVWELWLRDDSPESPTLYRLYRAERWAGLYPPAP